MGSKRRLNKTHKKTIEKIKSTQGALEKDQREVYSGKRAHERVYTYHARYSIFGRRKPKKKLKFKKRYKRN